MSDPPRPGRAGTWQVDAAVWAFVVSLIHIRGIWRLLKDELPVKFKGPDEEAMWRFFFRRSGMERLEFREVLRRGRWLAVRKGQRIIGPAEMLHTACLVVEGAACFTTLDTRVRTPEAMLMSGQVFPLTVFNVFGIYLGFDLPSSLHFEAWAETDVLLYAWDVGALEEMATRLSPSMSAYWRNFLLYTIGSELESRGRHGAHRAADGQPETEEWYGGARSRDFTEPLSEGEQRPRDWHSFMAWLKRVISPFPPPGLRHTGMPLSGVMARNRITAHHLARQASMRLASLAHPTAKPQPPQQLGITAAATGGDGAPPHSAAAAAAATSEAAASAAAAPTPAQGVPVVRPAAAAAAAAAPALAQQQQQQTWQQQTWQQMQDELAQQVQRALSGQSGLPPTVTGSTEPGAALAEALRRRRRLQEVLAEGAADP